MIKNIITLLSSGAIASLISFGLLPIISKFVTPSEMGIVQVFISIVALVSSVASFKYEMSIVTARNICEENLAIVCSIIALSFTTIIVFLISIYFYISSMPFIFDLEHLHLVLFISVGVLFSGFYFIASQIMIKTESFRKIGYSKIIQSIVNQGGTIFSGCFGIGVIGIITSYILSQFQMSIFVVKRVLVSFNNVDYRLIPSFFNDNIKLLKFNTPSTFINVLSLHLPIFLLSQSLDAYWIGLYMMANRLVDVPFNILNSSINPVVYKRFSDINLNKKSLCGSVIKYALILFVLSIILTFLSWLVSDFFVTKLLDEQWKEISKIIIIITIFKGFQFITSPIASILVIVNKQEFGLAAILMSIVIRYFSIICFNESLYAALISFTISASIFYLVYLLMIIILVGNYDKENKRTSKAIV